MKKTAFAFISLLAVCLIIVACSQQAEVEKPADKIPEAIEKAPDTTMIDSAMQEGEGMIDSLAGEAKEVIDDAVDEAEEKVDEAADKVKDAAKEATGGH